MTEQQKREIQMFGMTLEEVHAEAAHESQDDYTRLYWALSILSDAQEGKQMGALTEVEANQLINKAKHWISYVQQNLRGVA